MNKKLRIGILGAARIAPFALISPSRHIPEVEVFAVAARDHERAKKFARKHSITHAFNGYEAMLTNPDVDAIYNPLPNSLHSEWTIRALEAGKHVLCEKPLTANTSEAERVAQVAQRTQLVCMEAFHWRHHPLATRMLEILASGEIGTVKRIETWMCVPLPLPSDIRYRLDLAGGATMDVGCYAISMARHLAAAEPTVESAKALLMSPGVDRRMEAELSFSDGRSGHITCSLWSSSFLRIQARVTGENGVMSVINPTLPQLANLITVKSQGKIRRETVARTSTYQHQLQAFSDAVLHGKSIITTADDAVKNMRVVDAVYRAAGMQPRGTL